MSMTRKIDWTGGLHLRPEAEQLQCVFASEPQKAIPDAPVCCIIGPFKSFADKPALFDALLALVRDWNMEKIE